MKTELTEQEKIEAYRAGCYWFNPPPVCTIKWDEAAWIRYIGNNFYKKDAAQ